jgi:hypothetical protein
MPSVSGIDFVNEGNAAYDNTAQINALDAFKGQTVDD